MNLIGTIRPNKSKKLIKILDYGTTEVLLIPSAYFFPIDTVSILDQKGNIIINDGKYSNGDLLIEVSEPKTNKATIESVDIVINKIKHKIKYSEIEKIKIISNYSTDELMALRVFDIDDVNQTYTLKFGNFELNELVTVPKGYILNQTEDTKTIIKMGPNGAIEVNGPVNMLGELKIFGSDPNGSGSLFINADGKSVRIHDLVSKCNKFFA